MQDHRPLVRHADAMHHARVGLIAEARRRDEAGAGDVGKRGAGLQQPCVRRHLFMSDRVEPPLVVRRSSRAAVIGTGDVAAIAERADHAAVEHHQVARPDHPAGRLLLPGIGALARCQQPVVQPLPAAFDQGRPHQRPELLFHDPVAQRIAHPRHAVLCNGNGQVHREYLFGALDLAGHGQDGSCIRNLVPPCRQRLLGMESGALDADPLSALPAMGADQVLDLPGPAGRPFPVARAREHVGKRHDVGTALVDGLQLAAGLAPRRIVEMDHGTLGGDEEIARLDVHLEQRAVAHAGRVADRQRLEQDDRVETLPDDLFAQAVLPVAAHAGHVDHALRVHGLHRWRDPGRLLQRQGLRLGRKGAAVVRGVVHRCVGLQPSSASRNFSFSPGCMPMLVSA